MTVLFCDMKGFTSLSEGMTPQGLVKVMNHYLSTMSGPIRSHRGIIDKYIGDAIMAYWGPPFTEDGEQARLACLAAVEMADRGAALRTELPELLGVRTVPSDCDVRIGIATGEVLVGSIGSEFMMSYTVMGDAVNLASRLENANKVYGSHSLASEAAIMAAGDAIELREVDRLVVVGQTHPETVFEIIGRAGELTEKQLVLQARYAAGPRRLSRAPLGRRAPGLPGGAGGCTRRRTGQGAIAACREFSVRSAGRRLGWGVAARSEVTGRQARLCRQKIQHDSAKFLRRLFEHPMPGTRDYCSLCTRNMFCQHAPDHSQCALGVAAADQQCRCRDRFGLAA